LAARTLNGNNQKLSTRRLKANHESSVKVENEAAELRAGAGTLNAAKDAVFAARAAVEAEKVAQAAKAGANSEEAAVGGALTAAVKEILKVQHMSVQRSWNATLVWPDVRRLLTSYGLRGNP
jgi:hypothetical protein